MPPHRPLFWNIEGAWLFYVLAALALGSFGYGVACHLRRWRQGRRPSGWRPSFRDARRVLVDGLIGRRTFRGDPGAGLMHALILWGFAGLFVATVLSGVDHYLVTFLRGPVYLAYSLGADVAGLMLLAGLGSALWRRYLQRLPRLESRAEDLLALGWLLAAGLSGFAVEAVRLAITEPAWGGWSVAGWLARGPFAGASADSWLYPVTWWIHALLSLGLIAALPFTKLAHVLTSPASLALADQPACLPAGEQQPAYSLRERVSLDGCTRCGRCVEVCPAAGAGEPFSPRAIVVAIRDELRRARGAAGAGTEPGQGAASGEAAAIMAAGPWNCTTCRACVEVCPVCISPPDVVVELRGQLVERGTAVPGPLAHTLERLFKYDNPWESKKKRAKWSKGLELVDLSRRRKDAGSASEGAVDFCYFVGCTTAIDTRAQGIARSLVRLFEAAGVSFGTLGKKEPCCGDIARRVGEVGLFQEQAERSVAAFERCGVERLVTSSPHCMHTMRHDHRLLAGPDGDAPPIRPRSLEARHYVEVLDELIGAGELRLESPRPQQVTFHDPCYLARANGIVEAPRRVLRAIGGVTTREMAHHGASSLCCGGGGGRVWQEELDADTPMAEVRVREAAATGADLLVTACPLCLIMLEDARKTAGLESSLEVVDLAELCARALGAARNADPNEEER